MYNLSILLFRCSAPYIIIAFLDILSPSFNSLSFHCSVPAPYKNAVTAHAFIAVILFFSHLVLTLEPIETFMYIPLLFFFFHFILFDLIQFDNA